MVNNIEQKHIIIGAGLLLVAGAFAMTYEGFETNEDKVDVVTTFYPFYDITTEVAGDNAEVTSLVPPGTDPHSFEASPQDIQRLNNADIFVVTGAEFEEWETDLVESIDSDVKVVDASERIDLIESDEEHGHDEHEHEEEHHEEEHHEDEHNESHHEHEEEHHEEHDEEHGEHEEHGHDHDHGRYDPHYWLSPNNAQLITEDVADALREVDSENSETYTENEQDFISGLEELDSDFEQGLEECEKDRILITHAAFSYLGQDYGFEQVQITGLSHLTEPTGQELAHLQDQAEEHGLEHVFYDSMTDSSVADTIAAGIDAEVLVLHSIEGANEEPYIDLMEENLENLQTALQCQ